MPRFGYLGPEGTFCEMALRQWAASHEGDHHPFGSVGGALRALRDGQIDAAMVPIENSVEGGVSATLDALRQAAQQTDAQPDGDQRHIIAIGRASRRERD